MKIVIFCDACGHRKEVKIPDKPRAELSDEEWKKIYAEFVIENSGYSNFETELDVPILEKG